tara:strand:- start:254 stop:754 length:501 start_codon:yes stop_codon:yes gene_type:complete
MGLSIRKYATLRGVTEGAVRKAISSGRITPNEDGTIDVERADREWKENTDEAKINTGLPVMTENMPAANGKPSFTKIKTAHELYKAQLTQLSLQEKKGQLINKDMVKTQVYRLGRQVRDSWLNWPARVSALMAAELGIDEHALHQALERYVREHLNDIGEGKLNFD